MKKVVYIILLSLCGTIAFTSCTGDEVTPSVKLECLSSGGGASIPPKL